MSLNVFHMLYMLVHELVEVILGWMIGGDALFWSLERLVGLVQLNEG